MSEEQRRMWAIQDAIARGAADDDKDSMSELCAGLGLLDGGVVVSGDHLNLDLIDELATENSGGPMMVLPETLLALVAEVCRLRAKVAEVGRIHAPYDAGCGWDACSLDGETYPCATVVALDAP